MNRDEPLNDSVRLDAEQFAIDCAKRGIPVEYWPGGLGAAEELLNRPGHPGGLELLDEGRTEP